MVKLSKDGVFALKVEGDENLRKLYIKTAKGHLHLLFYIASYLTI